MSKRTYIPDRGDLIEINFQPAAGREIDKRRPAIVLTPLAYNRRVGLCLAVGVSSNIAPGPFWVPMPEGFLTKPSLIICDALKSLDFRERNAVYLGHVPGELVETIVGNVLDLLDPVS